MRKKSDLDLVLALNFHFRVSSGKNGVFWEMSGKDDCPQL